MLRGEALPFPGREIQALRERIAREYGEEVVPTASGPFLAVRVPHHEPDFLRDLEAAVDVLPYRDLKGFRGVVLLGDRGHMGVSADMLRALMEGKVQGEKEWIARLRIDLGPWAFRVTKMPGDPQRRLRAVFRVDAESVSELDEPDFERLAEALPDIKAASPGQNRPAFVHLVSHGDHVTIDGARFFTDLERRRRHSIDVLNERARRELEEKHAIALANLERITKQRGLPPAPAAPSPPGPAPSGAFAAPTRLMPPALPEPPRAVAPPVRPAAPDPFAPVARRTREAEMLRQALDGAGYRTRERLLVRDIPVAIAAARPEGYPTRVLVTFHDRLAPETANTILLASRRVGAELVLLVADDVAPGVDRVTLATHLKVIGPDAVADVRFG